MDDKTYENRRNRILDMRSRGILTSGQTLNILKGMYFMKNGKKLVEGLE